MNLLHLKKGQSIQRPSNPDFVIYVRKIHSIKRRRATQGKDSNSVAKSKQNLALMSENVHRIKTIYISHG